MLWYFVAFCGGFVFAYSAGAMFFWREIAETRKITAKIRDRLACEYTDKP